MSKPALEPRCYETVVRIIEMNTGGVQPPLASRGAIGVVAKHARAGRTPGWTLDEVERSLALACDRHVLFQWHDDDGEAGRSPGTVYYGLDDATRLREKTAEHATRASTPNRVLIGAANSRIASLANQ